MGMASRNLRREFLKTMGVGGAALALPRHLWATESGRKPNIVFIITDQQHAGMMSCAGNPHLDTPVLDRLAGSGKRFTRAYAANPVCLPARFSFFTGRMPSVVGIGENDDGHAGVPKDIPAHAMGWLMKSAGYETVYGGKTHFPKNMTLGNMGFTDLTRDERGKLAEKCAEFIKQPHDKPFLLVASFINPHDICYMAINDYARATGGKVFTNTAATNCDGLIAKPKKNLKQFVDEHCPSLPDNFEVPELEPECITTCYLKVREFRQYARDKWTPEMWRLHRWTYCRLTEMVDKKIGRVLDAVRDAGLEDDTLIVFTSDHGDHDSAHRLEHKSILYEESARIPFIMSYKGVIPAGTVDNTHLVSSGLDMLPTLCDYAGAGLPEGLYGASVRPIAEGKPAPDWRDHVVVESQNGRMVRTDRYKYCVYESGRHREQLTDLDTDPGEMKNLAYDNRYVHVLDRHRKLLAKWVAYTNDAIGRKYIVTS